MGPWRGRQCEVEGAEFADVPVGIGQDQSDLDTSWPQAGRGFDLEAPFPMLARSDTSEKYATTVQYPCFGFEHPSYPAQRPVAFVGQANGNLVGFAGKKPVVGQMEGGFEAGAPAAWRCRFGGPVDVILAQCHR